MADEVLDRARRGDADAFAALVRRYDRDLRALAFRLVGDRDRMDDVLQEAYIKVFRGLPRFAARADVKTWMYRITYNTCIDDLRRRRRHDEQPIGEAEVAVADSGEATVSRIVLADALRELPAPERAAVLLVDGQGMSYETAAQIVGVKVGTLASRLHRARAALRRSLAEPSQGMHT